MRLMGEMHVYSISDEITNPVSTVYSRHKETYDITLYAQFQEITRSQHALKGEFRKKKKLSEEKCSV